MQPRSRDVVAIVLRVLVKASKLNVLEQGERVSSRHLVKGSRLDNHLHDL